MAENSISEYLNMNNITAQWLDRENAVPVYVMKEKNTTLQYDRALTALPSSKLSKLGVEQVMVDAQFWQNVADLETQITLSARTSLGCCLCRWEHLQHMDPYDAHEGVHAVRVIDELYFHVSKAEGGEFEKNNKSYYRFFRATKPADRLLSQAAIERLAEERSLIEHCQWFFRNNLIGVKRRIKTREDLNEFMERLFCTDPTKPDRFKEIRDERRVANERLSRSRWNFDEYALELRVVTMDFPSLVKALWFAKVCKRES